MLSAYQVLATLIIIYCFILFCAFISWWAVCQGLGLWLRWYNGRISVIDTSFFKRIYIVINVCLVIDNYCLIGDIAASTSITPSTPTSKTLKCTSCTNTRYVFKINWMWAVKITVIAVYFRFGFWLCVQCCFWWCLSNSFTVKLEKFIVFFST